MYVIVGMNGQGCQELKGGEMVWMMKALLVMHRIVIGEEGALLAFDIVRSNLLVIYMLY